MTFFNGLISISNISTLLFVVFAVLMGGYALGRITVKGISLQDALEREETNKIMGVSSIVPSIKTQRENFQLKKRLYDKELKNFSAQTGITPYNLPVEPSFLTPSNLVGTALEKLTRFGIINSGDFVYLITPSQNEATYNDKIFP